MRWYALRFLWRVIWKTEADPWLSRGKEVVSRVHWVNEELLTGR